MKHKQMTCLLTAAMLACAMYGCSSGKSESGLSGSGTPQNSQNAETSLGESVKRGKITATVYDRGNVPSAEGTIEDNRWTKWINENGPVDVSFVAIPRTNSGEKLNVLFASGTAPDLVFEYAPTVKTPLYQQKQLMPLDDMIEQYSTVYKEQLAQYPSLRMAGAKDDGKLYEFGKINSVRPQRGIAIRADWLTKLNLSVPVTIDDYYSVMEKFAKEDPDGNGADDTYGIALSYRAGETFNQMIPGSEIGEKDGKWDYTWERLQARLDFTKKIYDGGLVDKEYMTDTNGARALQDFVNGKLGILPWLFGFENFLRGEYKTLKENVPEAEILFISYPETDYGHFMPTLLNPVQMTAVVNAKCKNPQAVMQFVDFACGEEFGMALKYGLEGTHYERNDGKPSVLDAEKVKNEVSWAGDFTMLVGAPVLEKTMPDYAGFNMDDPFEKECYEIYKGAMEVYLDPTLTYTDYTHSEHMPQLPKDLSTIRANIVLNEFYDKAIVGGSDYTVEQAIADAKNAWEKGGGQKILDWYANWYENDLQNTFSAADMIEIMEQEDYLHKLP